MEQQHFNRNILIAVDESENAKRAVDYVAQLLGGIEGFNVTLLHVIPEPEEDYFPKPEDREHWLENYRVKIEGLLDSYRRILIRH
jgi:nucleotide-binding universal stress UspA family protein